MTNSSVNPTEPPIFNEEADIAYGIFYCSCFLVGVVGNITSSLFFWTVENNLSSMIYRFITINDAVISAIVLPEGISFLSNRAPGPIFENSVTCTAWFYIWTVGVRFSVFLVFCLSSTRTNCIMRPFSRVRIWLVKSVILIYPLPQAAQALVFHMMKGTELTYARETTRCTIFLNNLNDI